MGRNSSSPVSLGSTRQGYIQSDPEALPLNSAVQSLLVGIGRSAGSTRGNFRPTISRAPLPAVAGGNAAYEPLPTGTAS